VMGWLGSLISIINKLLPGRRERLVKRLNKLEKELERALAENKALEISRIQKEMQELKRLLENLE